MKKVRFSVFETNSSSTHSLTVVPLRLFEKWQKGKMIFCTDSDELIPIEEAIEHFNNEFKKDYECFEEFCVEEGLYEDYDTWRTNECLETFLYDYVSESGDKIVVFGRYGNDNC